MLGPQKENYLVTNINRINDKYLFKIMLSYIK